MFGRNVLALLQHLIDKQGTLVIDANDEITGAMLITNDGRVLR
jgi:NAD/NADP transhydrogenase alpha subunit